MKIQTNISWGYRELLQIFFQANNLKVNMSERKNPPYNKIDIHIEDSDTEISLGFMSTRHLGLENMLIDYLFRCGVDPATVSWGVYREPRDMKKLENDWQAYRKNILGFR